MRFLTGEGSAEKNICIYNDGQTEGGTNAALPATSPEGETQCDCRLASKEQQVFPPHDRWEGGPFFPFGRPPRARLLLIFWNMCLFIILVDTYMKTLRRGSTVT